MGKKKTDNEMDLVRKIASVAVNSIPLMSPVGTVGRAVTGTAKKLGNLNIPTPPPPKERDIRDTVRYRQLAGSEGFQTVKPEAAQKAFDLREKAKEFRRRADSDKTRFVLREKRSRQTAARLDRESKEALNDLETPRKVTANVPKRATGPKGGRN